MPKIPEFTTIDNIVEFWESHDSAEYWPDMEAADFDVQLCRNIFHPKMLLLRGMPTQCPRCRSRLDDIAIEYVVENTGHLVVIREVPALRCREHRHEYMLEVTLNHIETLLASEITHQVQPAEMLQVPVFDLKTAV